MGKMELRNMSFEKWSSVFAKFGDTSLKFFILVYSKE